VPAHQHEFALSCEAGQRERLSARGRQRLLDERVLVGFQAASRKLVVREDRRGEQHTVDFGVLEHVVEVHGGRDARVAPCKPFQTRGIAVAYPAHVDIRALHEDSQQVWTPVPKTHDRHGRPSDDLENAVLESNRSSLHYSPLPRPCLAANLSLAPTRCAYPRCPCPSYVRARAISVPQTWCDTAVPSTATARWPMADFFLPGTLATR